MTDQIKIIFTQVDNLPNYYYKEDGKPMFEAIKTYIGDSIKEIYSKIKFLTLTVSTKTLKIILEMIFK